MEIIKSIKIVCDFNRNIKRLTNSLTRKNTFKVKITEKQMGILEYCAFLGIDDYFHLINLTGIDMPKNIKWTLKKKDK